jgi:hypothetical protein
VDDAFSETGVMKMSLGGIKFSEKLVHVSHCVLSLSDRSFVHLIERIAEKHINIPFLCTGALRSTFCIAAADFVFLEKLLDSHTSPGKQTHLQTPADPALRDQLQITHSVGTLTLFPHRRSLVMLGQVVEILGQAGIVIHSLCTSISAVALNLDFHLLDPAVEVLEKIVELPDNHAPFRPEFSVKQISL